MGCCLPKALQFDSALQADVLEKNDNARQALCMTEDEVFRLYLDFSKANKSDSGSLSEDEFHMFLDSNGSAFATRAYKLYQDETGGINFQSWLLACWSICTRDSDNLVNFAYQLYDIKGRGELGLADVNLLLSELFGLGFEEHDLGRGIYKKLARFDNKGRPLDAHVTIEDFTILAHQSATMCRPAFKLQHKLQEATLGTRAWETVTVRRDKLAKEGLFDVLAVVKLANGGRTRGGSVVPLDARHFIPMRSAQGPTKSLTDYMPGMRTHSKVRPEDDHEELKRKISMASKEEAIKAAQEAEAEAGARETIAAVKELLVDPLNAARRMSVAGLQVVSALGKLGGAAALSAISGGSRSESEYNPTAKEIRDKKIRDEKALAQKAAHEEDLEIAEARAKLSRADATPMEAFRARRLSVAEAGRRAGELKEETRKRRASIARAKEEAEKAGDGAQAGKGLQVISDEKIQVVTGFNAPAGGTVSTSGAMYPNVRFIAEDAVENGTLTPRVGSRAHEGSMPMAPRRGSADYTDGGTSTSGQAQTPAGRRASQGRRQSTDASKQTPAEMKAAQNRRDSALMAKAMRRASGLA